MYDNTHWWYTNMTEFDVRQRMSALDKQRLAVYAVGCVTHAKDVILKSVQDHELREFLPSISLLTSFWEGYPSTTIGHPRDSIAEQAEQVVMRELGPEPDEKFFTTPGAEPLLWGTLFSLSLDEIENSTATAFDALDRAYFAIYLRYSGDNAAISEGRMVEAEQGTKECGEEIRFQLSYLTMLESIPGIPTDYAAILSCARNTDAQ